MNASSDRRRGALVLVAMVGVLVLPACCKERVEAAIVLGHVTKDECLRKAGDPGQPRVACPGEEVTLCWASSEDQVTISMSGGSTQTAGKAGALHFVPASTTTVTVAASDCAEVKRQVVVVNEPTQITWDARWESGCSNIGYTISPDFVSESLVALDILADWQPMVDTEAGVTVCETPPFLSGTHTPDIYGFEMPKPFVTYPNSRPVQVVGAWGYSFVGKCPGRWTCNRMAALPFVKTVTCRQ